MSEITTTTLRRLMENDPTLEEVRVAPNYEGSRGVDFYNSKPSVAYLFPRGDVGWKMAGEIIGNNSTIDALKIRGRDVHAALLDDSDSVEKLRLFFNGAGRNSSMSEMTFVGWDMIGGSQFLSMVPLLENNSNLTTLKLWGSPAGNADGILALASALSSCNHRLETLSIRRCSIMDGPPFEQLVSALIPNEVDQKSALIELDLSENNIGSNGCAALGKLLSDPCSQLEKMDLTNNNIGNEGAIYLADALTKNNKLACLNIVKGNEITEKGWAAMTRTLCNESCINQTYLSNHTLQYLDYVGIGRRLRFKEMPPDLRACLKSNREDKSDPLNDKQPFAPVQKILARHHDWDMSYLIEEELKMLPCILSWMDRAGESNKTFNGITNRLRVQNKRTLEIKRLSTIHQFVQYVPAIVADKLMMHEND